MIERALTGDRRYWGWIVALLGVITVGSLFYLRQLTVGLTITGLSRDVTWGFYIAQFTFMVGVAASAVMVVLPTTSTTSRYSGASPSWESSSPSGRW